MSRLNAVSRAAPVLKWAGGKQGIAEVYFDSPYYRLGGYSDFNRYTKEQLGVRDHVRLARFCRELDGRGVRWAVSNSDTVLVRQLFEGYRPVTVGNRREINLNARDRAISELLILNERRVLG
jgi:DNA adenine methylase